MVVEIQRLKREVYSVDVVIVIYEVEDDLLNKQNKNEAKPKKAPLVYINRVKMTELDDNGKYVFKPVIKDANNNKVYRCELDKEEKKKYDKSVKNKINRDKRKHMILTAESELIRIIKHLSERNETVKGRHYIPDVLSLKVGRSYTAYKDKMTKTGMIVTYNGIKYRRIIVSSSHSRTQKAMLVSVDVWDKAMDILLCGLNRNTKYSYMSKWNSYIGLAATDSIPVSMPNIVVIDDNVFIQKAIVDVVREIDTDDKEGNIKRDFTVLTDREEEIQINLFDGAGLVTVEKAEQWSKELNLNYIPASFQFRCIPCLKGKLYTMPIEEFAKTHNVSKIIDIKGKKWDLFNDKIDCILTKSQFKFYDLYDSIETWRRNFEEEIHGYRRTFNISSYDENFSELKKTTVMAYQPLQTSEYTDDEIEELCKYTVDGYMEACSSVEGFLKYRGIISEQDKDDDIDWSKFPSYYKALYYNHSLFNDEFVQKKIKQDLKSGKERAYVGKIMVSGNYQTLTPDLYALMQHAFGLEITGLLKDNEVYSNYWKYNLFETPWIDIIRSPHIANEHCPAKVVTSGAMEKWFRYQQTGIVLSVFGNTIALKLNSADYDGDHVLTTDNRIICEAAKRNIANTIHHIKIVKRESVKNMDKVDVGDINTIIECDYKGYKNNIGNVINPISVLWSLEQTEDIQNYIKIMSIVGSITIDYAKHGEEAKMPKEIRKLLKNHNKPYFMKYLRSQRKKRSIEKEMKTNASLLGNEQEGLFDDSDCTMNKICHYMEEQIAKKSSSIKVQELFDVTTLLKSVPDMTTKKYKKIKDCLSKAQDEFADISNANYYDDDFCMSGDIEKEQKYVALYDWAKADLLEIENDISKLLDSILAIYYTDKGFMKKYQDKSILWGCFGEQLIERCKGNFSNTIGVEELEKFKKRREKALKSIEILKNYREKNFLIAEFETDGIKDISVDIYSEDITWIKNMISTKIEYSNEARKLLLALLYVFRKCKTNLITLYQSHNNRLNRTSLCKLVKMDRRHLDSILNILQERQIIGLNLDKQNHLCIELLKFPNVGEKILKENIEYQHLYSLANDKFREKVAKIVDKNCA